MIPKSVKIMQEVWKVRVVQGLTDEDGTECFGLTDFEKQSISIDASLSDERMWSTFFHELVHATLDTSATKYLIQGEEKERYNNEEVIVRALEYGLWPVIKNLVKKGAR